MNEAAIRLHIERLEEGVRRRPRVRERMTQRFPEDWNEQRVRQLLEHHENQSRDEAVAEDEAAACKQRTRSFVAVPVESIPEVREVIAKYAR